MQINPAWIQVVIIVLANVISFAVLWTRQITLIEQLSEELKDQKESFKKSLYQPDGRTTYMPRSECSEYRLGCRNEVMSLLNDLKEVVKKIDERERLLFEHMKAFQNCDEANQKNYKVDKSL